MKSIAHRVMFGAEAKTKMHVQIHASKVFIKLDSAFGVAVSLLVCFSIPSIGGSQQFFILFYFRTSPINANWREMLNTKEINLAAVFVSDFLDAPSIAFASIWYSKQQRTACRWGAVIKPLGEPYAHSRGVDVRALCLGVVQFINFIFRVSCGDRISTVHIQIFDFRTSAINGSMPSVIIYKLSLRSHTFNLTHYSFK